MFQPDLSRDIDRVRFALGDTTAPEWYTDATYRAVLTQAVNDERAGTIAMGEALLARWANEPDVIDGPDGKIDLRSRRDAVRALIGRLRAEQQASSADANAATAAGVSASVTTTARW